ncbi:MAG TPA: 6-bladed beta-propeller [bacterium]|nr:6-bladed beta-propeller [bacterium]
MKRGLVVLTAAALAAAAAWAAAPVYQYGGMWGKSGSGPGEFWYPYCVATAPNGNVYVTDGWPVNERVQYFTPTGSYLGQWAVPGAGGVDVSPSGVVYVTNRGGVQYYTPTGSLIGSWSGINAADVAVAPNGDVYVIERWAYCVSYYTSTGSFLGKWGSHGSGPGQFREPEGIAVAPNDTVYVTDVCYTLNRVQYFTSSGSFLGMWDKSGEGPGEFDEPYGIDVSSSGVVFVANTYNHCVDYFTSTGSFLGRFGGVGEGPGQFAMDYDVAVSPSGNRVYVTDYLNDRVQYFDDTAEAVVPSSLGRVKALFR